MRYSNNEFFKRIGLNPDRELGKDCADFYLLEMLSFEGNVEARRRLSHLEETLAREFALYANMAVGGEVRHAHGLVDVRVPTSLRAFVTTAHEHGLESDNPRKIAWRLWLDLRRQNPEGTLEMLHSASLMFDSPGWPKGSVGGPGWSSTARVLYFYLAKQIKARTFVDRMFTLAHNFGSIFDKTYESSELMKALELQASGNYDRLATMASPDVARLWRSRTRKQFEGRDEGWLGTQRTEKTDG